MNLERKLKKNSGQTYTILKLSKHNKLVKTLIVTSLVLKKQHI